MRYGDVCTGISATTVAWSPLGWKPVFYSEIEPFPCKLLKHYYPTVPNLGNMLKIHENEYFQQCAIDLLVGGTPCQDFSVAGLRAGLSGDRGSLTLEYCRILVTKRPRWFLWENVPGALSSFSHAAGGQGMEGTGYENGYDVTETSDFAAIITAFRECGYSCAWRVLDAKYFGVPQRRRRIFVVGYLGNDWRPPAAVLFESQSLRGNFEAGGKEGQEIAGTLEARTKGGGFPGSDGAMNGHITPCWWDGGQIAQTLDRVLSKGQTMPDKNRREAVLVEPVAYPYNQISSKANRSNPLPGDPCPTLTKDNRVMVVPAVRRLTPLECERLQGFPDNYTNIPGASDTVRYQSIGNSMPVPVMAWIGKRISEVDKFQQENSKQINNTKTYDPQSPPPTYDQTSRTGAREESSQGTETGACETKSKPTAGRLQ